MDTPETVKPDTPVQPMGKEAAAANADLVEGQAVVLEQDVSDTDRFGRLLRDVWVHRDGVLVLAGLELVREGYAQISTFPPDVRYASMLLAAQHDAQADGLGLWSETAGASPSPSAVAPGPSLPTFTSLTPVVITSGHKTRFRGSTGIYTWRDVHFDDPRAHLTWDVHSNLASGCRIDWEVQPLDGPAVTGAVRVKGKGRTTGSRDQAMPVGDAPLTIRSTCSQWLLTMQGKPAAYGPENSNDPGRLTTRVKVHWFNGGSTVDPLAWVGLAPLAAEAVAAVDGLAARRTEGDLSLLAAGRAGGAEHLAGAAIAIPTGAVAAARAVAGAGAIAATTVRVAGSLAAGATRRAATGLGKATLRVEVLLGSGEDELLSTVRAGQVLVVVHENENSSR